MYFLEPNLPRSNPRVSFKKKIKYIKLRFLENMLFSNFKSSLIICIHIESRDYTFVPITHLCIRNMLCTYKCNYLTCLFLLASYNLIRMFYVVFNDLLKACVFHIAVKNIACIPRILIYRLKILGKNVRIIQNKIQ